MNATDVKISDFVECMAISGKRITDLVIRILQNMIIVSMELIQRSSEKKIL